jgi:integrase/recombinase XerD
VSQVQEATLSSDGWLAIVDAFRTLPPGRGASAIIRPAPKRPLPGTVSEQQPKLTFSQISPRSLSSEKLRYQHTQAVRTALSEKYAPGTVNKMLAALRGVLKEAWRLGLVGV